MSRYDLLLLRLTVALSAVGQVSSIACSVCKGGEDITLPDREINIPGYEFLATCNDLNLTIPLALQQGSEECDGVQAIGSLCGCTIPDGACQLCPNGGAVTLPTRQIPLFENLFPEGIIPTCDLFEAYLYSTSEDDALCGSTASFLGSYCGCPGTTPVNSDTVTCSLCPNGESIVEPDKVINLFEFETCADFDDALRLLLPAEDEQCVQIQSIYGLCGCPSAPDPPCTLCKDGSPMTTPERAIPFVSSPFGEAFDITCALYEANLLTMAQADKMCTPAQGLGSYCGCPPLDDYCEFCPGEKVHPDFYNVEIGALGAVRESGLEPTCEFAETLLLQTSKDEKLQCFGLQQKGFLCGCNDGKTSYMSVETDTQRVALTIIPKVTASLSIILTLLVMYDILRSKARRGRTYGRIIGVMAVYDFIFAIAWFVGTWAVPVYDEFGDPTGVLYAAGNDGTCTAQAFAVELGQTTAMMNISLGVYFLLVINYDWKETHLKQVQIWLLSIPVVIGFALAFGGLPFYDWLPIVCQVAYFPLEDNLGPVLGFIILPISLTILFLTIIMVVIYRGFVREIHEKTHSKKYKQMATVVFWQAMFYLIAFMISWPAILGGVIKGGIDGSVPYWFGFFMAFVAPIQGFVNGLVYFHSRIYSQYQVVLTNEGTSSGTTSAIKDTEPKEGTKEPEATEDTGVEQQVINLEVPEGPLKEASSSFALTDIMDPCYMIAFEEDEEAKYDIVELDKKRWFHFSRSLDR